MEPSEFAEAVEEFEPLRPTELALRPGDIVTIISHVSADWFYGQNAYGEEGTFPRSKVKLCSISQASHAPTTTTPAGDQLTSYTENVQQMAQFNDTDNENSTSVTYALVLDEFIADNNNDYLSVLEGDTLMILKQYDNNEWLWARKDNGCEGYVPVACVSMIQHEPDGEQQEDAVVFDHDVETITPVENFTRRQPIYDMNINNNNPTACSSDADGGDQRLRYILTEVFDTEQCFLRDMTVLLQVLRESPGVLLDSHLIISYLNPIIDAATNFLHSLPPVSANLSLDDAVRHTARAFLTHKQQLEHAFATYSQHFPEIIDASSAFSPAGHAHIVRQLRQQNLMCFDLKTTLLKPVQRVLKYPLLLAQLKTALSPSNVHGVGDLLCSATTFKVVNEALIAMQSVAEAINESKRRKELLDRYRRRKSSSSDVTTNGSL